MPRRFLLWAWCWFALALLVGCGGGRGEPARDPHIEAVSVAPDFSAPDETGRQRTLSEFRGRPVVLYFYPKNGTPGCTREACAFRDAWDRLSATGAQVLGVSVDSVESHAAFKRQYMLPFPLLSDVDGRVLSAYGVPRSPQGYAARTTFVIDARGMIRRIFPEVDPAVHVDEVLPILESLAHDGVGGGPPAQAASSSATPVPVATKTEPTMQTFVYFIEPSRPDMLQAPTADESEKVQAHFTYLKTLTERGTVLLAGPSLEPPYVGIVIFYAADREGADAVMRADPAVAGGVFKARLSEFRVSLWGTPR